MPIKTPCIDCGELTTATRCEACGKRSERMRIRKHSPKASPRKRGYDSKWRRLSRLARNLQPFCGNCGATTDLQCDHTPEAWERYEHGLEIRLQDIQVLCGKCNREAGAARGKKSRPKAARFPRGVKVPQENNPALMDF